jgi:hypothetical protein
MNKSHGQLFYEAAGNWLTAWEKISKASQHAYTLMAQRYDTSVSDKEKVDRPATTKLKRSH